MDKNNPNGQSHQKVMTADGDSNFQTYFSKKTSQPQKSYRSNFDVDKTGNSARDLEGSKRFNFNHYLCFFIISILLQSFCL